MDLDALEGREERRGHFRTVILRNRVDRMGLCIIGCLVGAMIKTLESNADWLGLKTLCLC